jgi:hypothetical protein
MKYFPKIVGERVYLSPISLEDAERYTAWLNDPEVTKFLTVAPMQISLKGEREVLVELAKQQTYAIVEKGTDILLGNVGLFAIESFGVSFTAFGIRAKLAPWKYALAATLGVLAHGSLKVPRDQSALVLAYSIQAVILVFGGLLSLFSGRSAFACMGILLFVSDWLVGLRSFGNPATTPQFVKDRVFILILVTYYIPMLASIEHSLRPWEGRKDEGLPRREA